MAKRPVYITTATNKHIEKKTVEFEWFPGFSVSQKQKSVISLHKEIKRIYTESKILEVSSKSESELGVSLSAFNLMIKTKKENFFSVESAFQASKIFEKGGPYIDLLERSSLEAKKDSRLKNSGNITGFKYFERCFPINPSTFFYNWLYINTLSTHKLLADEVMDYDIFTDIEFNPNKSINCQAEAIAIFVSLKKRNELNEALKSVDNFKKIVYPDFVEYVVKKEDSIQIKLF